MAVDGFADAFTRYLGYRSVRLDERRASCWIDCRADLLDERGALHAGVLGYLVDSSAGVVCSMAALPAWVITADLQFCAVAPAAVGPVRADAVVVQAGKRQVLGEVTVVDEGAADRVVAWGTVNHLVIEIADSVDVPRDMPIGVEYHSTDGASGHAPLLTHFGVRQLGDGVVSLPIAGEAVNPLGILHGGLISLLVEQSARSLGGLETVGLRDMAIRFLRGAKHGDATATATRVASSALDSQVRVEVSDESGRLSRARQREPSRRLDLLVPQMLKFAASSGLGRRANGQVFACGRIADVRTETSA